ncbi:sugar transporter [Lutimaribacter marinistellae]|uniref:Sugar transporter n=1 Tax=Lutimaribacter marinistellae TaxID=1820329 RepID=A0ABV7TF35_9RHOB
MFSFFLLVIGPFAAAVFYLYSIAADQYASTFGFAVRSEELDSAQNLLGGLADLSGNSSSDTDILYEFIQSRAMVEKVNDRIDLRTIYSRPEFDPVFAFDPTGSIEDLVDYWQRMVRISYANSSGLLEVRANAFRAQDALAIAEAIVDESTLMINELSAIAREDATRYALEDLEQAVERLKTAREALTRFRSDTRIVDPSADIQGQMGLLNSLESQLAEAIIEMNLVMETAREGDPRVEQARRRIAVIESLIEQERQKFGMGGTARVTDGKDYSTLVGEFERLMVDREYAEKSYLAAQTVLDTAQAEAQRQSRYLATYAKPALPESAQYPQRIILSALVFAVALLGWAIGVLIYYSVRDRR